MAVEDDTPTESKNQLGLPDEVLQFIQPSPSVVTALAYRDTALNKTESRILKDHLNSWRDLLSKHGVKYDGKLLNARTRIYPGLIYHVSISIDGDKYPAAMPLVLDALYDLTTELPSVDWEIYGFETVTKRLEPTRQSRSLMPGRKVFPNYFV